MSKWQSETTKLESKAQLKAHRRRIWNALLKTNSLFIEEYPWWTDEEKELERQLFTEADKDYEKRKKTLKSDIKKLPVNSQAIYFHDIGIDTATNIDEWLNESLVK